MEKNPKLRRGENLLHLMVKKTKKSAKIFCSLDSSRNIFKDFIGESWIQIETSEKLHILPRLSLNMLSLQGKLNETLQEIWRQQPTYKTVHC